MAELIHHYREYRLSVVTHTPGLKILIYPPGASLPLSTVPFDRDRRKLGALIQQARRIVEDHESMTRLADNSAASRAPSWWLKGFRR
jgi:hypothetical protein